MTDERGWAVRTMLCDYAQVAEGKLFVSGGGWSLVGPGVFIHGLAIKVEVPWNEANRRHVLRAALTSEDGTQITLGAPPSEIRFESEFEVGRPPGLAPGTPLDVPLAVNLGPLELPAGQGYSWIITIDDQPADRVTFRTRPK